MLLRVEECRFVDLLDGCGVRGDREVDGSENAPRRLLVATSLLALRSVAHAS